MRPPRVGPCCRLEPVRFCLRRLFPNLQLCLEAINHTNTVIRNCVRLSATPYDSQNARHEQMLEKLWCVAALGLAVLLSLGDFVLTCV